MSEHKTQQQMLDMVDSQSFCALAKEFGPGVVGILNGHKPLLHTRDLVKGVDWYVEAVDMAHDDTTLYLMPEDSDD